MDSLIGNFQNVIQTLFTEFSNRITQEHENITVADLEAIWAKIPDNFNKISQKDWEKYFSQ